MLAISVEQILFCWLQLLFQLLTRSGGHPKGWKRLIPKFQCDLSNNFYEPLHELPKVWYTRALPPSGDWPHWCLPIQTEACSRQKTSSGSKRMACACGERRQRPRPYNGVVGHRTHNGREGGGGEGRARAGEAPPRPCIRERQPPHCSARLHQSQKSEGRGRRSSGHFGMAGRAAHGGGHSPPPVCQELSVTRSKPRGRARGLGPGSGPNGVPVLSHWAVYLPPPPTGGSDTRAAGHRASFPLDLSPPGTRGTGRQNENGLMVCRHSHHWTSEM